MPGTAIVKRRASTKQGVASKKQAIIPQAKFKYFRYPTFKPTLVSAGKQPFPKQYRCTHKYSDTVSITLNVNGLGSYMYSCNDIFHPDKSSVGHQPMYFDQLQAIYDHFTVITSKIKVTPLYSGGYATQWTVTKDDDTSIVVTNGYTIRERPDAISRVESLSQQPAQPIWMSWNAYKTFGGDPQSDNQLQGGNGAGPTEQTYYVIYVDGGASAASATVQVTVDLWYDTIWDELQSMSSS